MNSPSRCVPLAEANGAGAGGKVEGLNLLMTLGLSVPDGFVILHPASDSLPDDLEPAYDRIGRGRVAVRSSASDEDGTAVSFAGQHATVLNVEGMSALRDAIAHCCHSLYSDRAQAYRQARANSANGTMSVIVQRMVDARSAGAIFTADPTTARRDRIVVEAIKGTGDALMSGSITADHFTLDRGGKIVKRDHPGPTPCVRDDELRTLASDALRIEQHFGVPVDCEWAIDREGTVAWLQARPITTLPADPRELDSEVNPDDIYSRCNMDEMFPGVATPLTISTSLRALDCGEQRLYKSIATYEISKEPVLIVQQFGYPFLNLTLFAGISRSMAGGSETSTVEALCGKPVAEIVPGPRAPQWERMRNGVRYVTFMLFGRHAAKLKRIIPSIDLSPGAEANATYAIIDREMPKLADAWYRHVGASVLSTSLAPALLAMIAKGAQPTPQHNAEVARLLTGAEGVESYDIAAGITRIVSVLVNNDGPQLDRFLDLDVQAADQFLRNEASAPVRREYDMYLERHGHRCMREVELRAKGWGEDPTPIVEAVQSGARATQAGHVTPLKGKQDSVPLKLKLLIRVGQRGIRDREVTKSQVILVTSLFKRAYRTLARQMVDEELLPDEDLIFFLQHTELGELIRNRDSKLIERALARREVLPYQEKLYFKQNSRGTPEPVDPPRPNGDGILHGKPVSLGVVRGRARVAMTLADAGEVQPDEILIAPFMDVGLTPSFATIAGFASDVGSAISHGAVVAREYHIPAVVGLHNASATFHTGDLVELDADHGVLRRIHEG